MKPNIHPDYHEIIVQMTDGSTFKTRSTYGKAGDKLYLDTDIKSHNAWTGGTAKIKNAGKVAEFRKKFGNIGSANMNAETKEEKKS